MATPLQDRPAIIPPDATEHVRGLWSWPINGAEVYCPYLSADPLKDSEEWLADQLASLPRLEGEREYKLEFAGAAGKPVYPEYSDRMHLSPKPLEYLANRPIIRGWDIPGPLACVWVQLAPVARPGQSTREGSVLRAHVLTELYMDCGVEAFGERVRQESQLRFPQATQFLDWTDPAAFAKAGHDKRAAADVLRAQGILLQPGPTDLIARLEGVRRWLIRTCPSAKPNEPPGAMLLDPECVLLRAGFKGEYYYREIERTGQYRLVPEKGDTSHPHDALQMALSRILPLGPDDGGKPAEPLEFDTWLGALPRHRMPLESSRARR